MDLVTFSYDRSFVLDALRQGEIDYLEHVSEAAEADLFRHLIRRQVVQRLAETYPTPRKIDGERMGHLKQKLAIDTIVPLRANMDLYADAIGLTRLRGFAWEPYVPPDPGVPRRHHLLPHRPSRFVCRRGRPNASGLWRSARQRQRLPLRPLRRRPRQRWLRHRPCSASVAVC